MSHIHFVFYMIARVDSSLSISLVLDEVMAAAKGVSVFIFKMSLIGDASKHFTPTCGLSRPGWHLLQLPRWGQQAPPPTLTPSQPTP